MGTLGIAPRALAGLALVTGLWGCVATNTVIPGYADGPSKIDFSIVDARPADDKATAWMTVWVTSCDFGIFRVGDDASFPTRLDILRQDIERQLGDKAANTSLTVTRYRMFLNTSRDMQAANASHGLVGALMTPTCTKDKTTAGWYDANEMTGVNAPFVMEIEADYLGKHYAVRAVSSPDIAISTPGGFRNADQAPSIYAAIEKANLALITQLKR